ncbi:hypothetical protein DFQ14_102477 [Halopolyspora algeriensis]|uniref:Uncharacterized protein n=1 Tax=Halopolyspora algeriensis TaxID=1500506 RepID=A0A368VVP7_9ACTN|nr:hypothetical protein [Halopolyspora algeriensis]RCW46174.1 hypothetical protein DFQ14_102477 [Halopolyspora algeriensis]TQM55577.1 hypothetical protein FHU43_0352 [Halopolyspora algeriensis]
MTGARSWSMVAHDAGALTQAIENLEASWRTVPGAQQPGSTRDALLTVTEVGTKLAKLLDALATQYENPGVPEQRVAHLALDQAAAAAEDLGACTRRAAQALQSGH